MTFKSMGFIGGGRVTAFLLRRLKEVSALPDEVIVSDPDPGRHSLISSMNPERIHCTTDNVEPTNSDLVVLAVHPPQVDSVCSQIAGHIRPGAVVLSLIPTVRLNTFAQKLQGFDRIVRMIPNAPSVIGQGFNPVAFSEALSGADRAPLQQLFAHWGISPEVPEECLEAYAVFTGMGPTYFWFQWLTLKELALQLGLAPRDADQALAKMLHGAVETLFASGLKPEEVLDLIPSYPLKKDEEGIGGILRDRIEALAQKLTSATR